MPYYHLSLNTDQPVAIKTRISARRISKDSAGNESNSNEEMEPVEAVAAVTVGELHAMVQLLQLQVQDLGKNVEAVIRLNKNQKPAPDAPGVVLGERTSGFWRKLGMLLGLVPRR